MTFEVKNEAPVKQIAWDYNSIFNFIFEVNAELPQVNKQAWEHETCKQGVEYFFVFPASVGDKVRVNFPNIFNIFEDPWNGNKISNACHEDTSLS